MIYLIKIGGGKGVDIGSILQDAADLIQAGERVVIVHGASHEIKMLSERLGQPEKFFTSPVGIRSRYTDPAVLEVTLMAFDRVNREIVSQLRHLGVPALGLSAMDGGLVEGKRKTALRSLQDGRVHLIRDDHSARISHVNPAHLLAFLDQGLTPVISPPAFDLQDGPVNVDADRLAAAICAHITPSFLFLMTNVAGLQRDKDDPTSLITSFDADQFEEALAMAHGRMRLKVLAAQEALAGGVEKVIIANGNITKPIHKALAGHGTTFTASAGASPSIVPKKQDTDRYAT